MLACISVITLLTATAGCALKHPSCTNEGWADLQEGAHWLQRQLPTEIRLGEQVTDCDSFGQNTISASSRQPIENLAPKLLKIGCSRVEEWDHAYRCTGEGAKIVVSQAHATPNPDGQWRLDIWLDA